MADQADLAAAEGEVPVEVGPMMDSFAEDPPRHWRPSWRDRKLPGATHCLGKPEKDDQFFSWDQSLVVDKNKDPMLDWAAYQDVRMDTWPVTPQEQGYAPTPSRFSPRAWVLLNNFFFLLHPSLRKFPVGGHGV